MKNEPVAWIVSHNSYTIKEAAEAMSKLFDEPMIPLYTHPVKELTDKEIISIYQDLWKFLPSEEPDLAKDIKKFARAILRKAQEK